MLTCCVYCEGTRGKGIWGRYMEGSASTHVPAPPLAVASEQVAERRDDDRWPMVFLGSVLAVYLAIGLAIYLLVAALT